MPPPLALTLCAAFVVFVFVVHISNTRGSSIGSWLVSVWMALIGSKPVTLWLYSRSEIADEGNDLDVAIYLMLIGAAFGVLVRRHASLGELVNRNRAVSLLLAYMALSVLWSDFPFASLKRYVKLLGMFAMALVVLTDRDPIQVLKQMTQRCAYLLIPVSLLLIKYYPDLGMSYDEWSGRPMVLGVTGHKNYLGRLCLVVGLVFLWDLYERFRNVAERRLDAKLLIDCFIFVLTIHLLFRADSMTAVMCFVVGAALFVALDLRILRKRPGVYIVLAGAVLVVLEGIVGIYEPLLTALGRNPTLTNRTNIWSGLMLLAPNVVIGAGYDSFWTPERQASVVNVGLKADLNSSHSGFLDVYLNLGLIGVALYSLVIVVAYRKCAHMLRHASRAGNGLYVLLIVVLLYSVTETAFKGLSLTALFLYIIALDVRRPFIAKQRIVTRAETQVAPLKLRKFGDTNFIGRVSHRHVGRWQRRAVNVRRGIQGSKGGL